MNSSVVYLKHALVPQARTVSEFRGRSIAELDPGWERPYICLLDGDPVLRGDWELTIVECGHVLVFVDVEAIPQGGGGSSNPLKTVMMLAVIVAAVYTGGAAAGAWAAAYGGTGAVAGALASSAVMMAGSMLVNALMPPSTVSQSGQAVTASPTYSIQAQGNSARLEAAIPEQFGRMAFYPDLAATPYQEFHGNEQYVYILLCLGRGQYAIENIFIEDTPIAQFSEVNVEITEPGEKTELFPGAVVTSVEVVGQDLATGVAMGPFTANPAGTKCTTIGIDYVAPKGIFYAEDNGSFRVLEIRVRPEAREINDLGVAVGDWFPLCPRTWVPSPNAGSGFLFSDRRKTNADDGYWTDYHEYRAGSPTQQRFSEKYVVTPGRYEVRVTRLDTESTDTRAGHDMVWGGLRAYLEDDLTYGDVTLLGVRMRATSQLSGLSSRKIKVIATRKLPKWNGTTWLEPEATTSIAWAFAYACKQIGMTDAQIDLPALVALDDVWYLHGDSCNGRIDNSISFWDAATRIAQAGRSKPFIQGGVVRIFRDAPMELPVALFSMRNIAKGSLSVDYLMPTDDTADAVDVVYFDNVTWSSSKVRSSLPDSVSEKPAKIELALVTSRDQAYREGVYQAACNRYRRKIIKFSTEMEGFIPSFGDLIVVQHDMPGWGQGGEAVAWDGVGGLLTTSEAITWAPGQTHYIGIRRPDGSMWGPYQVEQWGDEENVIRFLYAPDFDIRTNVSGERTHYVFGWGATWGQKARVLAVRPKGLHLVEIEAVNEEPNVHSAEDGIITPVAPVSQLDPSVSAPSVYDLIAIGKPGDPSTMLLSWRPSAYADHYVVELSADGLASWDRVAEPMTSNLTCPALFGATTFVRVAAVGLAQGPWATAQYTPAAESSTAWDASTANFTAAASGAMILLTWDTSIVSDAASYEIRVGASWEDGVAIVSKLSASSFSWSPPGTGTMVFWLKAIDNLGNYSAGTATTTLTDAIPTPTGLTADGYESAVYLQWDDPAYPALLHVEIWRNSSDTLTGAVLAGTATGIEYIDNVPVDGTYYYWIRFISKMNLAGPYNSTSGTAGTRGADYTAPPAPTGLTASGVITAIILSWDDPPVSYHNLKHVEIWRSLTDDIAAAVLVAANLTTMYSDPVDAGSAYYYWIRFVSKADVVGPYNASAGTLGETAIDPGWLLETLTGEITASQLHSDLGARIDLVDAASSVAGSVAARILAEATARGNADDSLQTQIDLLVAGSPGDLGDLIAAVEEEQTARVTADAAEATARQTLASQLTGFADPTGKTLANLTTGLIYEEKTTRTSADGALATRATALESAVNSATTGLATKASVSYVDTAKASAISSAASTTALVSARLDTGDFAAVKTQSSASASSVTGLQAQYTVKIDSGGKVCGFGLASATNTTTSSIFEVRADKVAFLAPYGSAATGMTAAFAVDTSLNRVAMDGAYIKTATITDAKISSLAATKITAGTISSAITYTGTMTISTNGYIRGGQTGYATGTGFFLGYSGSAYKFSVGSATKYLRFDGTNITISGDMDTAGYIYATGYKSGTTGYYQGALNGVCTVGNGVVGVTSANGNWGVVGQTDSISATSTGGGVAGICKAGQGANSSGVRGFSYDALAPGVRASSSGGLGLALKVEGTMQISSSVVVTNLNADSVDGLHIETPGTHIMLHSHLASGSAVGTFAGTTTGVTGKPGSNSTSGWLKIYVDNVPYYIPIFA